MLSKDTRPRRVYHWRHYRSRGVPRHCIVFDCETNRTPSSSSPGDEIQTLRFGWLISWDTRYGVETGRWYRFTRADEFWDIISTLSRSRQTTYIFAHNAPFDLACVDFHHLINERLKVKQLASTSQLFFARVSIDGKPLYLIDTTNFYKTSVAKLGQRLGIPKLTMPHMDAPVTDWDEYCRRDVEIIARLMQSHITWLRDHHYGKFQPTAASQAMRTYCTRFMRTRPLVYRSPVVNRTERDAYYGGIVDATVYGRRIEGPIHELDVTSMYPSVCRHPLPYHYETSASDQDPEYIDAVGDDVHIIAQVEIDSPDVPYPVRRPDRLYWCIGRGVTTLAMPELRFYHRLGCIRRLIWAQYYRAAPIFQDYMNHFLKLKLVCDETGDVVGREWAKLLLNSLYGKTGQLTPVWMAWESETFRRLECEYGLSEGALQYLVSSPPIIMGDEDYVYIPEIGQSLAVRDMWGYPEVHVGTRESRYSCPAIAATVTSYARCLMREFHLVAGRDHWFYSDTDSIWVDSEGLRRLTDAGYVRRGVPGFLSVKGVHEYLIVYAPKDYQTNVTIKRKGIRSSARQIDQTLFQQSVFPGLGRVVRDNIDSGLIVRTTVKRLRRSNPQVIVGSDGRVTYRRFCDVVQDSSED